MMEIAVFAAVNHRGPAAARLFPGADPRLDRRRRRDARHLGRRVPVSAEVAMRSVSGSFVVLVAPVLNVKFLRRKIVSDHVLAIFRRILPDMSQTEKEAIDAGTVWWDADLFSGKPDWNKMLAIPAPRLSAEEQAFVDGPCEEVCAMTNDWEVTHERYDLLAAGLAVPQGQGLLRHDHPEEVRRPRLLGVSRTRRW